MGWRQIVGLMVALLLAGAGMVLAQEPLYRESHALLIGVTASGGRTESAAETERFGAVLRSSGWETTVRIDPERERLAESVEKFLGEHGGEERNRLLIYFAGESRTDRRGEPCLLAAPGPQGAESCLEIARIEERLRGARSRHLLLILNASLRLESRRCGERVVAVTPVTSRSWVSIVAGAGKPPAHFRSGFSFYLLRAFERLEGDLDGDGVVTARELGQYLSRKIDAASRGRWRPRVSTMASHQIPIPDVACPGPQDLRPILSGPANDPDLEVTSGTRGGGGQATSLPAFDWPPPRPTDEWPLPRKWFARGATLGEVAEPIERALARSGYRYSYYQLPEGFALACSMERVRPDGSPIEGPNRWRKELPPLRALSLPEMLRALLGVLPGHYRVIVFTVTGRLRRGEAPPVSSGEAGGWVAEGADRLPPRIEESPFRQNHRVTALVYEFVKRNEKSEVLPAAAPLVSAREHLRKARLYEPLSEF